VNKKKVAFYKKLLNERLNDLRAEASKPVVEEAGAAISMPDTVDLAQHEFSRDFHIRLRDRERKLIHKIELALERTEDGTYGKCMACGAEIGEKRLIARPMATHCIDCKTEAETLERIRGR
jgi:DnaK suppressor protein